MPKTTTKRTVLNWRSSVSIVSLIAASAFGATASAQTAEFDIEAGNAADALNAFARQADRDVVYAFDAVEGIQVSGLEGTYDINAALNLLLTDTGLEIAGEQNGAIAIRVADLNTPVPMRQVNDGGASDLSGTGQPVSVEGTVKGAITDSNLAGARVEIVETGQVTATDNLGRFRFAIVAPGTYTLRISYLGRETIQETIDLTSGDYSQSFAMGFPTTVGVTSRVDVIGTRSAREQALNQERTAPNSQTVINADQLGSFNGTTISETLRRVGGVAFVPDENTGDGANIVIRGLEPDLNQITLNGLRLLDGSGVGRSPDLSGILTESIESVTINKSLLPSQDTNGAGGLVEIETKSPLDRERRFASFGIEYGENSGDFGDEFLVNGTLSGIFGENDDFGASLSVSYRERDVTRISYSLDDLALGEFLPAGVESISDLDPRLAFPFEDSGAGVYPRGSTVSEGSTEDEILSITGTLEKEFGGHTNLRFDLTYNEQTQSTYNASTIVDSEAGYGFVDVAALGGDERLIQTVEDPFTGTSLEFFGVTGILADVQRQASISPNEERSDIGLSFRGDTEFEAWDFNYAFGYRLAENDSSGRASLELLGQAPIESGGFFFTRPAIERDFLTSAIQNNTIDGRIISIYAPLQADDSGTFVLPGFTETAYAFYNDLDSLLLERIRADVGTSGESDALTLSGSARRNFSSSWLGYVEAGFNYQDTTFSSETGVGEQVTYQAVDGVALSELGLAFGPGILESVGASNDFAALNRGSFENTVSRLGQLESQGLLQLNPGADAFFNASDIFNLTSKTGEETAAFYLQGQANFGKLELVGGVRAERLDLTSTFFTGPSVTGIDGRPAVPLDDNGDPITDEDGNPLTFTEAFGQVVEDSISQTDILPRINANYRISDDLIIRGSYFTTVSRPQIRNLTDRQQLTLRLRTTPTIPVPTLVVSQGNPDLEPATTHNLGLDVEYYTDDVGVLKASIFHKTTENPLQTSRVEGGLEVAPEDLVIPDIPFFNDLPENLNVTVTRPINGEDDLTIWGVELTAERQFTFLPGAWSGLGIYANYTYTDSERTARLPFNGVPEGEVFLTDVPFVGAPEHSGTAGLTYRGSGVDASLLYSFQDRRLASFEPFLANQYNEAIDSLDLRIDYIREINDVTARFFIRGNDLLKDENDPVLETSIGGEFGVPQYYTGGTYFGGRSIFLGVSASF